MLTLNTLEISTICHVYISKDIPQPFLGVNISKFGIKGLPGIEEV